MTEGCPIPFATRAVLQREEGPCGIWWTYVDPLLSAWMSFTENMDIGAAPPASLIKFDIDDAQHNAVSFAWVTNRCYKVEYIEGVLGPTDVDLKTFTTHPNFKTALGALVFPFDMHAFELNLSGTGKYIDPLITIVVEFQSPMDQTVAPLPSDLNIYANDVVKPPDTVTWLDPTHLQILYSEAALGVVILDIELQFATDRLRCLLGSVIPPFRLDTLPPP